MAALRLRWSKGRLTFDGVIEMMPAFTAADLKVMKSHGANIQWVAQPAGSALYVSAGWLCAEEALTGHLIYGMRNSLLVINEQSFSGFQVLIGLLKEAKTTTEKMEEVADLIALEA